jgi:hypothetical protein
MLDMRIMLMYHTLNHDVHGSSTMIASEVAQLVEPLLCPCKVARASIWPNVTPMLHVYTQQD